VEREKVIFQIKPRILTDREKI